MFGQAFDQALIGSISRRGTSIHYDIDCGQVVLMGAKGLANQALYAIAAYRVANRLGRNRQSQARCGRRIHPYGQRKESIRMTAAFFVRAIEIRFATQSLRRPEAKLSGGQVRLARTALRPRAACVP